MLREAATIKEGSYFIYRDSLTGFEDSFNVYYYINTTKNYQGDDARIQEFIIGTMHNIDSSKNLGYFIDAKVILDKEWLTTNCSHLPYSFCLLQVHTTIIMLSTFSQTYLL